MLKTKEVVIPMDDPDNRDKGKRYLLTEWPALRAERWARHLFMALANSGIEIPDEVVQAGFLGVFIVGLRAFVHANPAAIDPLADEMLECIQYVPTGNALPRKLVDSDIEEILTLFRLRQEVIELHMGFTFAEAASRMRASAAPKANPTSKTTPTSPA